MRRGKTPWNDYLRTSLVTSGPDSWPPEGMLDEGNEDEVEDTIIADQAGRLMLSEAQRRRWGVSPGAEILVEETPEGLLLRPLDPPLTKVYVEPTTACNLNCPACMRQAWTEPVGTMEMSTYRHLVAGLAEVPSLQVMSFWGFGEPLLHPHIAEMVRLAKGLKARTELVTNGLLLDPEMAKALVLAGLDRLVVSIDGATPETHADARPDADLGRIQHNLEAFRVVCRESQQPAPEIGIAFVLTKRNLQELASLRGFARSLGASFIMVSHVLPYTEETQDEVLYGHFALGSYLPLRSPWEPEIVLPKMDVRREALFPLLELLEYRLLPAIGHPNRRTGYCRFVDSGSVAVAWDGGVSPCVGLMHSYSCFVLGRPKNVRRYTVGNVAHEEIRSIWESEEYREFRARVQRFDFAPCARCGSCDLADANEEDCYGNVFPVCGGCLWAQGVIQCP